MEQQEKEDNKTLDPAVQTMLGLKAQELNLRSFQEIKKLEKQVEQYEDLILTIWVWFTSRSDTLKSLEYRHHYAKFEYLAKKILRKRGGR